MRVRDRFCQESAFVLQLRKQKTGNLRKISLLKDEDYWSDEFDEEIDEERLSHA